MGLEEREDAIVKSSYLRVGDSSSIYIIATGKDGIFGCEEIKQ